MGHSVFFIEGDGFRLTGSRLWCSLQRCEFEHVSIPVSSFRVKREIFVIRGQVGNVWKVKNGKPVIERLWGIVLS